MRVVVMTGRSRGLASLALPALHALAGVEVVGLIRVEGRPAAGRWKRLQRTLHKLLRIGPAGALNGVRMRRWYGPDLAELLGLEPVEDVARSLGIAVRKAPGPGATEAESALAAWEPDLALSLGNGYIPERVYSRPRLGMLNVHHELLPDFRGAQSVLWQIHEGSASTGFTIHEIDRSIDTGRILLRREVPMEFGVTLGKTVTASLAASYRASVEGLVEVVPRVEALLPEAAIQGPGQSFTTPSWRAFRRMVRNHDRLRREAESRGADERG